MALGASSAQSASVWAGAQERARSSAETVVSLTTSQRSERHTFRRASAFPLRKNVIRLESDDEVIAVTPHCHLPAILHETVPHHLRSNAAAPGYFRSLNLSTVSVVAQHRWRSGHCDAKFRTSPWGTVSHRRSGVSSLCLLTPARVSVAVSEKNRMCGAGKQSKTAANKMFSKLNTCSILETVERRLKMGCLQ